MQRLAFLLMAAAAAWQLPSMTARRPTLLRAETEAALAQGRTDALKRWREDSRAWIGTQADCLAPHGRMVIVVGDGLVGDRMVDALGPTVESLQAAGLTMVARASADRPDHARESIRIEHMVMAERV